MAVSYTEHEITSGGARVVLSVWASAAPEAAIMFVPATMVHPLFYEALLHGFAERGFAVVGLHPVGHGKSPREVKRYTIRDIVGNGRDAVTFALERFGLPVIAFGSSQGGVVAAVLAAEDGRLAAAFPHNLLLTELPQSIYVSRFPRWLRHLYRPTRGVFKFCARILPDLALPLDFYMKRERISTSREIWDKVGGDPLCLTRYPLHFLGSLFTTEFPGLTDGSVRCPVYVVADSGDKLFTADYTRLVFERLRAPHKELVVFDFNDHMLMVSHPSEVSERLAGKMREALRLHSSVCASWTATPPSTAVP
ncbi:MAG: lysophospholipase [Acidobacteriota bacterium]|jgi:alpha-beta hydrolase superfamily lysophospholipase|nr:lysophospholipase [Acidobacteriota bacterium]